MYEFSSYLIAYLVWLFWKDSILFVFSAIRCLLNDFIKKKLLNDKR